MLKINVLQKEGEILKQALISAFKNCNTDIELSEDAKVSVFTPGIQKSSCSSRIVIAPDSKSIITDASEIITYGLCCKNTLTISSYTGNNMVLSLQRSILTLSGTEVEVQDFPVTITALGEPEVILATVATLIACDVPVPKISTLPF